MIFLHLLGIYIFFAVGLMRARNYFNTLKTQDNYATHIVNILEKFKNINPYQSDNVA